MLSIISSCLLLSVISSSVWAYTINGGSIDVGNVDTLLAQSDLGNSSTDGEKSWVESILGFEIILEYKNDGNFNWTKTDPINNAVDYIYAEHLDNSPEYYLIKMGNLKISPINYSHFLFSNLNEFSYAVIDLAAFGADLENINIGKVSHYDTFNDRSPVPEPATMLLFGFGLMGIAAVGKNKRKSI